jgi:hypothetical protein
MGNTKLNRGTSWTSDERKQQKITGLVPRGKVDIAAKVANVMENIRSKVTSPNFS